MDLSGISWFFLLDLAGFEHGFQWIVVLNWISRLYAGGTPLCLGVMPSFPVRRLLSVASTVAAARAIPAR